MMPTNWFYNALRIFYRPGTIERRHNAIARGKSLVPSTFDCKHLTTFADILILIALW